MTCIRRAQLNLLRNWRMLAACLAAIAAAPGLLRHHSNFIAFVGYFATFGTVFLILTVMGRIVGRLRTPKTFGESDRPRQ